MSSVDTSNAARLEKELSTFTGTIFWYKHSLFRQFHYTDGVRYLADKGGCYWLIDRIFALQFEQQPVKDEYFQFWKLAVHEDENATLTCSDGNYNLLHSETIPWTDFPLPEIKLYLTDSVLLLPSEY